MPELHDRLYQYTFATREIVDLVEDLAARANHIHGDFVECGVCNGGLSAVARLRMIAGKRLWLFDSFEGLPETTAEDGPDPDGIDGIHIQGQCKGRLGNVQAAFEAIDAPMSHTNLIIGRYAETFHTTPVPKVSFLMLDSDFYAAEILCWRKFWPLLSPGAYVFMDDYFYWPGCYKAANEFLEAVGQKHIQINRVGRAAWIQRRL